VYTRERRKVYNQVHFTRYPPEYHPGIIGLSSTVLAKYHPGITLKVDSLWCQNASMKKCGKMEVLWISRD
jgi:hypothetical protein